MPADLRAMLPLVCGQVLMFITNSELLSALGLNPAGRWMEANTDLQRMNQLTAPVTYNGKGLGKLC